MVATTVCFTAHRTSRIRVTRISGTGAEAYIPALTVPAGRMVTGHDYVFICTGIAGNFRVLNGLPSYIQVVPYFGTPQLGTPQLNQIFRQLFSFAPYLSNVLQPETHTGQSFLMMLRKTNWPAATDFHIAAQMKHDGNAIGVDGFFDLDGLSIQVWDTTNLTASGVAWEYRENITEVDLPDANAAPIQFQNFTHVHAAPALWLVAKHVNWTPKSETASAEFWLDEVTQSQQIFDKIACQLHGLPPGVPPAYDWQYYPLGNFRLLNMPATWQLRTSARDNYTGGTRGRHHFSATFAVEMVAGMFLQYPPVNPNPQPNWWGTGDPWDGEALELAAEWPFYLSGIVMAAADSGPIAGRWLTKLEADGAPISGNSPLAVLSKGLPTECIPQHRVATYGFGTGKHFVDWKGNDHWLDPTPPQAQYDGKDIRLFALNGVLGVVPPDELYEGPGPESPVLASKETSIALAAFPELPFQPSYGTAVTTEGETREMRTPTGYDVTHPKFERGRRTVRLTWAALSLADALTLVTWAKDLTLSNGAFRWTMTGDLAQRPYAILAATIPEVDLRSGGPRSVSFDALELLFYT